MYFPVFILHQIMSINLLGISNPILLNGITSKGISVQSHAVELCQVEGSLIFGKS